MDNILVNYLIFILFDVAFWYEWMNNAFFYYPILIATLMMINVSQSITKKKNSSVLQIIAAFVIILFSIFSTSFSPSSEVEVVNETDRESVVSINFEDDSNIIFTRKDRLLQIFAKTNCIISVHYGFKSDIDDVDVYVEDETLFIGEANYSIYPSNLKKESGYCKETKL